jgi:hypothetical protein
MSDHHIVPRFVVARWADEAGLVTLADLERLKVREESPADLDALPDFNRLEFHEDHEALENRFFGALESNAARAFDELVAARRPLDHLRYASQNGLKAGQMLKLKRAVRFAQFLAAQAVRSPDWRHESNRQTAAAIAEELEKKVRAQLRAASDPEEIARLESMLGLRYHVQAQGDMLPQLSAALTTAVGQVLYCEYVQTVIRVPEPMLVLGNDPVMFMDSEARNGIGSYSQIASSREMRPFSVRQDIDSFIAAAVDVVRGHKLIVMPLDARHAVVLHPLASLAIPGLYEVPREFGLLLNTAALKASRRWVVVPPGESAVAVSRHIIYVTNPRIKEVDERRAEHGLSSITNPG